MFYYEVLLPKRHLFPLTYVYEEEIPIGSYVWVPLHSKKVLGVIWNYSVPESVSTSKIKPITDKLDLTPLNPSLIKYINWVSDYLMVSKGTLVKLVIPKEKLLLKPATILKYVLARELPHKLTKAREEVVKFMQQTTHSQTIQEIIAHTKVSNTVVTSMKKGGILESVEENIEPDFTKFIPVNFTSTELSLSQKNAFNTILKHTNNWQYKTILFEGVTGSGKTEVYFEVIKEILKQNTSQIFILLPEILLTTQLIKRFEKFFGFNPAVWHSTISEKDKKLYLHGIITGKIRVLIGARSALFLPFYNLKLIIVDEEHESSYKQEEGVSYNARDMAVARGYFENFPVILASATPSIETLFNVQQGKYAIVKLESRYGEAILPDVTIIDIRKERDLGKNHWLSKPLKTAMTENLNQGFQTIIFLNRRGYAPLTICRACGQTLECQYCSTYLIYHKAKRKYYCHYCDYSLDYINTCPKCEASSSLYHAGPGVERIAEEIKALLPDARIILITRDTVNNTENMLQAIEEITEGKVDIIIGTQMIAKGHHFANITLVGVVDADVGNNNCDLRAAERNYQLLYQVAGRAGREKHKGRVLLQTYNPDNPILKALAKHSREEFLFYEIEARRQLHMPPFSKLVALIISAPEEKIAANYAAHLRKEAPLVPKLQTWGPIPAPLSKLRNHYRYRLLIKAHRDICVQKYVKQLILKAPPPTSVKIKIDIDPYNFV